MQILSIPSALIVSDFDSVAAHHPNLATISSIDVSFCDRVNHVSASVDRKLSVGSQLPAQEVVALELVVKNWHTELIAGALDSVSHCVVRTDGVVAVADTLSFFIKSCHDIEGVVREETSAIESVADHLGN